MAKKLIPILSVLILIGLFQPLYGVHASMLGQDLEVVSFNQSDLDSDGKPDLAELLARYVDQTFKIVVVDQGSDMQWSSEWTIGTDFVNDIWLFKTAGGDQTRLILRFSPHQDGFRAELFDDFDGDGHVAHRILNNSQVEIQESSFPTLNMTSGQPWLLPGDRVNYLVSYTLQRPLPIWFMQPQYFQYLPQEGRNSFTSELVDASGNGVPDYELERVFPEAPDHLNVFRSRVTVIVDNIALPNFEGSFFWPYLGRADIENWSLSQLVRRQEDISPPIKVDWDSGQIKGVESFLPLWGLGNQWIIFTTKPIEKNKINELDWEVFAYYDFTDDTVMDVSFRLLHQPVPPVQVGSKQLYLEQVSYAWHHQNRDSIIWDYELELAGLHEKPSTEVDFKDFSVYTVPYQDLLHHFSQPDDWAYATFVVAESNGYQSNEGIWEWGTLEGVQFDVALPAEERVVHGSMDVQQDYMRGWSAQTPADLYTQIREGFRGEYADLDDSASLYFSPVDHRLHLLKAQKGLWNLGQGREIRYQNLGGDYLDTWILVENGEPITNLYAPPGHFILQDNTGVHFYTVDVQPALFSVFPPRDRNEWEDLDRKLIEHESGIAPDDFKAMVSQFGNSHSSIKLASIRDFRKTDKGFRFVLILESGYELSGDDILGLIEKKPGQYLVSVSDKIYSIQLLTPPKLKLEMWFEESDRLLDALRVRISNEGLQDLPDILPSFSQICGNRKIDVGSEPLDLHGEDSKDIIVYLPVKVYQPCTIQGKLLDNDGKLMVENSIHLSQTGTENHRLSQVLLLSNENKYDSVIITFLLLIVACVFMGLLSVNLPWGGQS